MYIHNFLFLKIRLNFIHDISSDICKELADRVVYCARCSPLPESIECLEGILLFLLTDLRIYKPTIPFDTIFDETKELSAYCGEFGDNNDNETKSILFELKEKIDKLQIGKKWSCSVLIEQMAKKHENLIEEEEIDNRQITQTQELNRQQRSLSKLFPLSDSKKKRKVTLGLTKDSKSSKRIRRKTKANK